MTHTCPACGYPDLAVGPKIGNDYSYDICPCCSFEFGYTDADQGYSYEQWRTKWIQAGMMWWSTSRQKPAEWSARLQLRNIGVIV